MTPPPPHESGLDTSPAEPALDFSQEPLSDYDLGDLGPETHLASVAEKKRLWWWNAFINMLFIASWFVLATAISVYNKWMFSPEHYGFQWPLFVTSLHMVVQFCLAASLRAAWPRVFRPKRSPGRADYAVKVLPTGITTSLDIGFSNVSLKTITLSFYTMVKSSSLIFVLLFAFLFRLEIFSLRLVGVIFFIFIGVVLMVASETQFVLSGFLLALTASASGGLRWSLTQMLLKSRKIGMSHPVAALFWLAPVMFVTLACISAVVDGWGQVFQSKFFDGWRASLVTAFYLIVPGIVAFCMVVSEFYIIKRAGVVPMAIAGIAKEVTTITVSAWVFGDQLTPLNMTGVGITVLGIGLFTHHKYRKSMDSSVPLDAHGNPVIEDEEELASNDGYMELRDTERFATGVSDEFMVDDADDASIRPSLFSVLPDGAEDADELRSIRSSMVQQAVDLMEGSTEADETAEVGGASEDLRER